MPLVMESVHANAQPACAKAVVAGMWVQFGHSKVDPCGVPGHGQNFCANGFFLKYDGVFVRAQKMAVPAAMDPLGMLDEDLSR